MKNINRQMILGQVGKEVEVKTLDSDKKVAKFSVATNEYWKDKNGESQESTEWHNVVVWKPMLVDYVEKNIQKGGLVYVEGTTKTSSWEKDGVKHSRKEVHPTLITSTEKSKNSELDLLQNFDK